MLNILHGSSNFLIFPSYFQSVYLFVLLSESPLCVPNVVLFNMVLVC